MCGLSAIQLKPVVNIVHTVSIPVFLDSLSLNLTTFINKWINDSAFLHQNVTSGNVNRALKQHLDPWNKTLLFTFTLVDFMRLLQNCCYYFHYRSGQRIAVQLRKIITLLILTFSKNPVGYILWASPVEFNTQFSWCEQCLAVSHCSLRGILTEKWNSFAVLGADASRWSSSVLLQACRGGRASCWYIFDNQKDPKHVSSSSSKTTWRCP